MSAAILKRLGVTPELIRKHVVRIEPPLRAWNNKTRAVRLAAGLTTDGTVRKRAYVRRGG